MCWVTQHMNRGNNFDHAGYQSMQGGGIGLNSSMKGEIFAQ